MNPRGDSFDSRLAYVCFIGESKATGGGAFLVDTIVKVAIGVALGLALYFNSSQIMAVGGSILAVVGVL